jgi:geranylgeranylglycerol-phosphate geranylgeranyltransferase
LILTVKMLICAVECDKAKENHDMTVISPLRKWRARPIRAKARAIFDLMRPELPLAGGICIVAGEIIALGTLPPAFVGLMGFLTGFFISGAAMISNDYFDLEVDQINHPQRPLPSGRISIPEVVVLTALFSASGFITSGLLGPLPLAFAVFIWIVAILYNWKYKTAGIMGNMMVGLSVAWFFIFGGVTVGGLTNGLVWIFGALAFIFNLGEEIAADAMDMEGDQKRSAQTIALVHGKEYALRVSSFLFMLFVLLSFIPFAMGWLSMLYLVIFVPMDLALLYFNVKLLTRQTTEESRKIIRKLYLAITFFVIAFVIIRVL